MGLKRWRHKQRRLRIGLPGPERYQLLRRMTDVFVEHERLETTWNKAKALRVWVEPMVTWARSVKFSHTSPHGQRVLRHKMANRCENPETLDKMFEEFADRYRTRTGGYVRILKTRRRYRDDAVMAFIEFVDRDGELRRTKEATSEGMSRLQYCKQRKIFESKPGKPRRHQKLPEVFGFCPPHLQREFVEKWKSGERKTARNLTEADLADIAKYERFGTSVTSEENDVPIREIYVQSPETMETVE